MAAIVLACTLALVSFACALVIVLHAFRQSTGTGVMVLCIPCFIFFYAFDQFEHRHKGLLLAGWLGALLAAAVLYAPWVGALTAPGRVS